MQEREDRPATQQSQPLPYNDFGHWLQQRLGHKTQKISIDAGFTCPNRDGTLSVGGCSFCDNTSFSPLYCRREHSIATQIANGKAFFARKYSSMQFLAYFQSYSNTYAPTERLRELYCEALEQPGIAGIVIGTRPDCIDESVLTLLEDINKRTFLIVEYGVESMYDRTLERINRHHSVQCSIDAINETHKRGIITGAHLILGLPGESHNDIIEEAHMLSELPLDILKAHQLQILKGTPLAQEYIRKPFPVFSVEEYLQLVITFLQHLRADMIVDRFVNQSPDHQLIAPRWGMKNHEFTHLLVNRMNTLHTHQGAAL